MNPWFLAAPACAFGFAGLTAYAAVHPRSQLFGPTTAFAPPGKLALTFDDGPNPAFTPQLLDLLERHNARATFFLVGKFVRECGAITREIRAHGHEIANHTDSHPNLFFCGPQETREELLRCTEAIRRVTWEQPRWFRPPFGFRNPWLNEIVHSQGMRTATWSLLPGDWRAKSAEWLTPRLQPVADRAQANRELGNSTASHRHGDIVCLHDGDYTHLNADRTATLSALAHWLPRWRDLGLEFVTMSFADELSAHSYGRT